ncbi:MAG: extracellular solute-binding protein [Armatimonadetes bacterium]|nr:extracellular solute-binding protein [Armatimonadota bacterium]
MRNILIIIAVLLALAVAGCGNKSDTGKSADGKIVLEVASFQGGFGLDFFEYAAREYEKLHPNIKINLWGNPRVWEQLRPRFVRGDVPDLTWPGWDMDVWAMVVDGQVMEMDKYLETKAYGSDKTWKETFYPSLLDQGKYNGHYYIMPFNNNIFGWWYNVDMFKKHGWTPPKTYEELLVLCEKIKKTDIAPITFQGKYPGYMLQGFFFPWAISEGGLQGFYDAQNLKEGAWKAPAFLKAAEMVAHLRDKGYFQKGAMGMSHTESQMEFVLGRAAMIPCGTWIGSEMKKQLPPTFHMEFLNPPVLANGKGDPSLVLCGVETWIIPKAAKHPDEAADFYKFMTSLDMAKKFIVQKNTLMSIQGSDDVDLPPTLVAPAKYMNEATTTYATYYSSWYRTMGKAVEEAMASLMNGQATPQQCVDRMEKAAQDCRKDKSIAKHKIGD